MIIVRNTVIPKHRIKSKVVVASTYIKCRSRFTSGLQVSVYKITEYSPALGRIQTVIRYVFVDMYIAHFDIQLQFGKVSYLKAFTYCNISITN